MVQEVAYQLPQLKVVFLFQSTQKKYIYINKKKKDVCMYIVYFRYG